jgi:cytochrome P450
LWEERFHNLDGEAQMTEATSAGVDMQEGGFGPDPYAEYARLRAEAPVHYIDDLDGIRSWLISRYDDVRNGQVDTRLSKVPPGGSPPGGSITRTLHNTDPPDHTRLRRLISRAFTPRRISERLRPRVQEITDELLDRVAMEDVVDLLPALAVPLPVIVICELIGVPVEDRGRFLAWFDPEAAPGARQGHWGEAMAYFSDLAARRRLAVRADLTEDEQPDLISVLIAARDEGDALSEEELSSTLTLLAVAGQESTLNLIASGMLALLENPDQLRLLRERPELGPSAVEELLRYTSPQQRSPWFATEDITIGGVTIPGGGLVSAGLASANRDPARFHDPERLDITRRENHHLAFGHGIHFCLGAPLARQEAQIAISTLLRRFPDIALACAPADVRWRPFDGFFRGLVALPVRFRGNPTTDRERSWI